MKCIKQNDTIKRVSDSIAETLVMQGKASYSNKEAYKLQNNPEYKPDPNFVSQMSNLQKRKNLSQHRFK